MFSLPYTGRGRRTKETSIRGSLNDQAHTLAFTILQTHTHTHLICLLPYTRQQQPNQDVGRAAKPQTSHRLLLSFPLFLTKRVWAGNTMSRFFLPPHSSTRPISYSHAWQRGCMWLGVSVCLCVNVCAARFSLSLSLLSSQSEGGVRFTFSSSLPAPWPVTWQPGADLIGP